MVPGRALGQSISVTNVTATPVCAGSDVTITFSVTDPASSPFYSINTFYQVYLSDATGTTYTAYGSTFNVNTSYNNGSTTSGLTHVFTIPSGLTTGTGYKIAIGSTSSPGPTFDASNGSGASAAFTINAQVAPTVGIVANPGNNICAGTSVTFTATPSNQGASPSYQWYLNGAAVGSNSSNYTNSSLANTDKVYVVLTSSLPCATGTATSNTVTMAVNPVLAPSVSISPSATTICQGTSVTFTASVPTNGGSSPAYQWQLNGSDIAGATSSTYTTTTLSNNDVVSLSLTSNATCASPTTVSSNSITMTVNPLLTPSVSIAANPGNIICSGTSVTFTAIPTNEGSTPSYQWQIDGSNVGTNSPTYTNNALTNGQIVTCILTSNATCASPATATSNSITMTVNANLPVSVVIGASATTICAGTNVTFTATPTNPGTTPSYQWQVNGSNVGTNSATFSSSTLNNNDVVKVILTSNATPCATGSPATSNSITMTVNPVLTPSVSIAANPGNIICSGTSVTFTAIPTNEGSTPSYQWKVNGSNVGTNSPTYTNNTLTNGQIVTCVLTSNAMCAQPTGATSNGIQMSVFASNPAPGSNWNGSTNITSSSYSICPPNTVTLTVPSAANVQYYQWTLPVGWSITSGGTTSTTNSIDVTIGSSSNTGTQVVSVQAFNPCGGVPRMERMEIVLFNVE